MDLLIKDKKERILLSWRDDPFAGVGWHIPGSIVRYQERLETRLTKMVENEIAASVEITPEPIVQEITQDFGTQYMIQQQLQDIYNSLDKIKQQKPIIIYMSQEELEALEEPEQDNKFQEELVYEEL